MNSATDPALPPARRTRVKICGLSREADVDAAVAAGADAVGFVMYPPSPRFVTVARAAELARRLPPFMTPVLLFVNESPTVVRAASQAIPNLLLQFHGDETPEQCVEAAAGHPFMRAARIPLGDGAAGFDLVKIRARVSRSPSHPARRRCRGVWRRRQGIQLVTASSKRQLSPRLKWWAHACKRDRWHLQAAHTL